MNTITDTNLPYEPATLTAIVELAGGQEKLASASELKRLRELQEKFSHAEKVRLDNSVEAAIKTAKTQLADMRKSLSSGKQLTADVFTSDELKDEARARRHAAKQQMRSITADAWNICQPILERFAKAAHEVAKKFSEDEAAAHARFSLRYTHESILVLTLRQIAARVVPQRSTAGMVVAPANILQGIVNL